MDFEEMVETIDDELQDFAFEMSKSRVYAKLDEQNYILAIEGEYSLSNIDNFDDWTLIEEGEPCDRLNLAQTHYLEDGVFTEDGIPQYKWTGTEVAKRTTEEIEMERNSRPQQPVMPTDHERLELLENAMLETLTMLAEE